MSAEEGIPCPLRERSRRPLREVPCVRWLGLSTFGWTSLSPPRDAAVSFAGCDGFRRETRPSCLSDLSHSVPSALFHLDKIVCLFMRCTHLGPEFPKIRKMLDSALGILGSVIRCRPSRASVFRQLCSAYIEYENDF